MARCIKCPSESIVELKHSNLKLCLEHFNEYFVRRVSRTIERYHMIKRGDKVLVAVSGGKDSLVLLDVLTKISDKIDFSIVGVTLDLGIKGYSPEAIKYAVKGFKDRDVEYLVVDLKRDYGFSIDDVYVKRKKLRRSICSVCGLVKRHVLNDVALKLRATKVATGHTLDDVAQYILIGVFSGNYEQLAKVYPISISELEGLVTRIKPLAETPEEDILAYATLNGIEFLKSKCPHSKGALSLEFKELLVKLEEKHPGLKVSLVRNFHKKLHPLLTSKYRVDLHDIKRCQVCGIPTTSRMCSFCKLRTKVRS